ncbi:hypothetical protein GCM10011578_021950 [Streptomyces fuscichromogenes]|uniref:Amino acid permease n=1 Tax=Streptomyces fuscichromogenes TaxID=1324013 RepID=A0A917XA69_9ACTN|nr:hypothetical protein GCM10011578_021950 [Streptomyces fuscichromogenes]
MAVGTLPYCAVALSAIGGGVIAFGAVVAIASVVLMSMSRDGLIPRVFEKVSPRTATPVAGPLIVAAVLALPAAFASLDAVMNLCTVGTLAIMAVVNIAVIALRRREPALARAFRVPLYPVVPLLGVGFCLYLRYETGWTTCIQFAVFLAVGLLVCVGCGRRNSTPATAAVTTPGATDAVPQEA